MSEAKKINKPTLNIEAAVKRLKSVVTHTPLQFNANLSRKYECNVYFKREDLQIVRSYKLRGAYNMMSQLSKEVLAKGVVCASAGNHAQGFSYSCKKLGVKGVVFMPIPSPQQKVNQTKMFGEDFVEVILVGDTFDDTAIAAKAYTLEHGMTFIPPFDHVSIIEGQATVGVEILDDIKTFTKDPIDYLFVPVGGGGLSAGVGTYFKEKSPSTKIIGLEPEGAPSMFWALKSGEPVELENIDKFVDGASVKRVGDVTFSFCKDALDDMHLVPEGKICTSILQMYNEEAIVVEPAGAMSVAALDHYADQIKGKTIVCIVSGGNNDIARMQEIKERSLTYEGLKHYFLIRFAQRPGSLKEFVNKVLGPYDDITRFEYIQKHNKEAGPALLGIELRTKADHATLIENMKKYHINYDEINKDDNIYGYLI
ncbi:MAG: threonine ammonia-lyase [Chitinophagia bacterium]|nr:threonine ammonia-lyase [Chitinophagia bacterium]NCA30002.1 threonine ammonia-lyase [Chitinophagia bacterium]